MSLPHPVCAAAPQKPGHLPRQAPAHRVLLAVGPGGEAACLQAWANWRQDGGPATEAPTASAPQSRLSMVLLSEAPPRADVLRALGQGQPDWAPLAEAWARQCWGLSPGFHRLQLEQGRLQLTLCIGPLLDQLRELQLQADQVHWGVPAAQDPQQGLFKAMARLCRRGATLHPADSEHARSGAAHEAWQALGFQPQTTDHWVYQPAWAPRRAAPLAAPWPDTAERSCVVVGGGLAGLGTAHALARRGWQVTVLDAATEPAQGASGLPAGLFSPHVSPDNNRISRLTRTGLRLTRDTAERLLTEGQDWAPTGVMEHRVHGKSGPRGALPDEALWSHEASAEQKQAAGLPAEAAATWHPTAGWVRPARLVSQLLAEACSALPGRVTWRGGCRVARLQRDDAQGRWQLLDEAGAPLASTALVVVAAGPGSRALCEPQVPLQALRGQLSWAVAQAGEQLPPHPVNGQGSLIPHLPLPEGQAWYTGSTFDRAHPPQQAGDATPVKAVDHDTNLDKLAKLLPATAASLRSPPGSATLQAWAGIRCTSPDRVPLVGPVDPERLPGVWACTALGTRGLTWGLLCAELLAAQLSGEPLPIELSLARSLLASRPAPGKATPLGED
ncbi:FAD-dependent 5-carboxymethylaminomethyl-2-thiouridine(34) oxidoreductase MnmC [Curvibacter sp. HBC61]|uniref:FAD-dependent 5-carboxymethylaminomethyl-2-thiouridine(34) oxidoreductase MnmC n=1 Tax=Curvibacter cyanobacteriorum TaxID=3026422 RepID=A0ABT5MZH4_9BURK|nr:FAD-dependent 5-carboxymethylaminomethyl-2-thiouridine(34) oxidoreductase MnmC [Curvibacter sp. HBC61]MDD0838163.1 FAD-dependent 5-carboxymethylaminomethyl-2-thiouridine(34) oxidoreductase MnmC [Curvibacter sp. HBC61]